MDSLIIAIKSGADAVYLAGKKYGARASAVNFSDEEMKEAVKLCHLYGVKIYITVNTLIYESEFPTGTNNSFIYNFLFCIITYKNKKKRKFLLIKFN